MSKPCRAARGAWYSSSGMHRQWPPCVICCLHSTRRMQRSCGPMPWHSSTAGRRLSTSFCSTRHLPTASRNDCVHCSKPADGWPPTHGFSSSTHGDRQCRRCPRTGRCIAAGTPGRSHFIWRCARRPHENGDIPDFRATRSLVATIRRRKSGMSPFSRKRYRIYLFFFLSPASFSGRQRINKSGTFFS